MITAIILTKNESENIARCIKSLKFCDHILVIDDESTDATVKIAKDLGAKVVDHKLAGDFSAQRNWAMTHVSSGWILFVDADETISPELAKEITELKDTKTTGYFISRIDILWGRKLLHGDARTSLLRLAKAGEGGWVGSVHETWQNIQNTSSLIAPLYHCPHPTVADFMLHINTYSSLKANEFYTQKKPYSLGIIICGPMWRFIKNYLFKFGFLDGTPGFIHALMMSFYTYLVASKLFMLQKKHA